MIKKRFLLSFICIFFVLTIISSNASYAADPSILKINSPSVLLIERKTGTILYEKNSNEVRYPASLTKIMTAIVALENASLNDVVTVSYNAIKIIPSGYSIANLKVDEQLTVEQLLHLLLLRSASDASNALAEHIAGSIGSFADIMNTKAKELGCENTNFVNPDGLHNTKHVTTASDLAKIANYAMNNTTFRSIVSKSSYILYPTNKTKTERTYTNSNLLLDKSSKNYYYDKANGIKTGFTTPAGNCLAACSKQGDLEFIVIILGATQTKSGLSERFLESKTLFDYAFGNYTYANVENANDVITTITVPKATNKTKHLEVKLERNIYAFVDKKEIESYFEPKITFNENLKAPIASGAVVGTVTYTIEGIDYTSNLLAVKDVKKSSTSIFVTLILIIIVLIVIYFYLDDKKKRNKKRNRVERLTKVYKEWE